MIVSMTGFAARRGHGAGAQWQWDIRSVNGKGLDVRLRLPDWIDGLEQAVRAEVTRRVQRGNVALSLRVQRDAGAEALRVNRAGLDQALAALAEVTTVAEQRGLLLEVPTAADVLAMRGVLDQTAAEEDDTGPLRAALVADLGALLDDFTAARRSEGAALAGVVAAQLDRIGALTADAAAEAAERRLAMADNLREALARVLANADGVDEARLAQELALIAVKADVTEEIDRLTAHVAAARALLADRSRSGASSTSSRRSSTARPIPSAPRRSPSR